MNTLKTQKIVSHVAKLFLTSLFVFLSISTQSRSLERFPLTSILSPEQMKEDIDFLFETLEKSHANIYAITSRDSVDRYRKKLYEQCSEPKRAVDFAMILQPSNVLFDGHTGVYFPYWNEIANEAAFFPEHVEISEGKLFLSRKENAKLDEIISINGISVSDIYHRMVNLNEINMYHEFKASRQFASLLLINASVLPPYNVEVWDNGELSTINFDGVKLSEVKNIYKTLDNQVNRDLRIYPEESIAIIDYNTCGYDIGNEREREELVEAFRAMFGEINDKKIKHLFIDISRNGGGNSGVNNLLFSNINTPDSVTLGYAIQRRFSPYESSGPIYYDSLQTDVFYTSTPPSPDGYKGKLYLIQGRMSYSAAMGASEWVKASDRGTIIGEETGQATAVYIDTYGFDLPNSKIPLGCSFKYWKALPDGRPDQGVLPDVPVKLDYTKSHYGLNDLLDFMKQVELVDTSL